MSFKNNLVCEEFSKEMWRYLDGSLSVEGKAFWDKHLSSCASCMAALNEIEKSLSIYEGLPLEDISDEKFDFMTEKAVNKSRFITRLDNLLDFRIKLPFSISYLFNRFSLSAAALAAAVVILLIIYKPKADMKILPENESNAHKTEVITDGIKDKNNSNEEITSSTVNSDKTENNKETAGKIPLIRTRQEVMEWKAAGVKDRINEVGYSLDLIDASQDGRKEYMDKWTMNAAALNHEIERLEKEINNSSM